MLSRRELKSIWSCSFALSLSFFILTLCFRDIAICSCVESIFVIMLWEHSRGAESVCLTESQRTRKERRKVDHNGMEKKETCFWWSIISLKVEIYLPHIKRQRARLESLLSWRWKLFILQQPAARDLIIKQESSGHSCHCNGESYLLLVLNIELIIKLMRMKHNSWLWAGLLLRGSVKMIKRILVQSNFKSWWTRYFDEFL